MGAGYSRGQRVGEVIRGERWRGSPPSPVLGRAGSNLTSSRGKGFAGAVGGRGRGLLRPRDSSTPLRCARNDIWVEEGECVSVCARTTGGRAPTRDARTWECARGRGWVPAFARTREGNFHPNPPSSRGQAICEDNGWGVRRWLWGLRGSRCLLPRRGG